MTKVSSIDFQKILDLIELVTDLREENKLLKKEVGALQEALTRVPQKPEE